MSDQPLLTIAHRAGNDAADLRAALDAGVDLVEADIHLYRDDLVAAVGDRPRLMLDLKGPSLAVAPQVATALRRAAPDLAVTVCTKQWRMFDAFDASPNVRRVYSASDPLQLRRLRARLRGNRVAG